MLFKRMVNAVRYARDKAPFSFLMAIMLYIAFFSGTTGIMAVLIKESLSLLDTDLALVFFASSFGFMLFYYVAGKIAARFGYRTAYVMGCLLVAASGFLMLGVGSLGQLITLMVLQGAGFSTLTILSNAVIPMWFRKNAVARMNLFHMFYALGSAVSKPVISAALARGMDWRFLFAIGAGFSLLFFIIVMRMKLPGAETAGETGSLPRSSAGLSVYAKKSMFWLYILVMGCYLISEVLTGNWFVNYAWEGFAVDSQTGANYLFAFFLCATVGKLLVPQLLRRAGHRYAVPLFALIASLLTFLGMALGPGGLWLIAGAGLFFSIIYPTLLVQASGAFPGSTASVLGAMGMMANMFTTVSNLIVGAINVHLGVRASYLIIPSALLLVALLTFSIARHKPSEQPA